MSTYSPLVNAEAPAIPSLDQLRSNQTSVEMAPATISSEKCEKTAPVMVESFVVTTNVVPAPVRRQDKWLVTSCCCGCSLSTGVYLIALIETLSYIFALFVAALAIYFKTQENKIDHHIRKHDETDADAAAAQGEDVPESTDQEDPNAEDEMTTDEKIDKINHVIDIAAYNSPILILLALIGLFFCYKGFQASRGDAKAAHLYYKWKLFAIFWAFVQMIFGDGFGGFVGFLLAIYYCIVVKSHWLNLSNIEEAAPADSITVTTCSEVRPNLV